MILSDVVTRKLKSKTSLMALDNDKAINMMNDARLYVPLCCHKNV